MLITTSTHGADIPEWHITQIALLTSVMPGSTSLFEDEIYAHLIQALVDARQEAALRQVDVALRLGRPQAFVSRYETLERRINMGQFVAIAQAIGVDPVKLLAGALREVKKQATSVA